MAKKLRRHLRSKWTKTRVLLRNRSIAKAIPETRLFTKQNLRIMLDKYEMVYVKPDNGSCGIGVMKVEKTSAASYNYHSEQNKHTFDSFDELHASLVHKINEKKYLIQRGIRLLKYQNRISDIRVIVQLNEQKKWVTTGIVGRIADPGKVVVNAERGKNIYHVLGRYVSRERSRQIVERLEKLGVTVAKQLKHQYPGFTEIGLDIGLDHTMKPWIIEVNTRPGSYVFYTLPDKTMFHRIMRYQQYHQ